MNMSDLHLKGKIVKAPYPHMWFKIPEVSPVFVLFIMLSIADNMVIHFLFIMLS